MRIGRTPVLITKQIPLASIAAPDRNLIFRVTVAQKYPKSPRPDDQSLPGFLQTFRSPSICWWAPPLSSHWYQPQEKIGTTNIQTAP